MKTPGQWAPFAHQGSGRIVTLMHADHINNKNNTMMSPCYSMLFIFSICLGRFKFWCAVCVFILVKLGNFFFLAVVTQISLS